MAANIQVSRVREGEFSVTVVEGSSRTKHTVTVNAGDYARLAGDKIGAEELITKSFEFLLEREPKESILPRFNLMEIARYFPSFESEMAQRLRKR